MTARVPVPLEVVWLRALDSDQLGEYARFVNTAAGGHYAQMPAWDEVVQSVRRQVTRYALVRRGGQLIGCARVSRPRVLGLPLPLASLERGPVVADVGELSAVLAAIARAAGARGIGWLRVMPYWSGEHAARAESEMRSSGWKNVQTADGSHARTLRMALEGDPFAGAERAALRRKLRAAERAGVTVRQGGSGALDSLHELHALAMRSQGRSPRPRRYLEAIERTFVAPGQGAIFVAEHQGMAIAALVALRHGSLATFVLGAAAAGGGNVRGGISRMAPAMAAAVLWAKANGCAHFDLGGIPLSGDPDAKRRSIAQFKLDFAKSPVFLTAEHARAIVPAFW